MRVFVLAGGFGTRLQPYTEVIPKCLVPVGGKPCVRHIVDRLQNQEFHDVILCVNRDDEQNFRHEFRDVKDVKFSVSEEPLGTAGEIFCARKLIDDTFMIIYGDDLTFLNYGEVRDFHVSKKDATATLVFTDNIILSVGVAVISDDRVEEWVEKPPIQKPAWTGIAVLEPEIIKYLKVGFDFGKNVFPTLLKEGKKLYAYVTHNLWVDVGNVAHLRLANKMMEEGKI